MRGRPSLAKGTTTLKDTAAKSELNSLTKDQSQNDPCFQNERNYMINYMGKTTLNNELFDQSQNRKETQKPYRITSNSVNQNRLIHYQDNVNESIKSRQLAMNEKLLKLEQEKKTLESQLEQKQNENNGLLQEIRRYQQKEEEYQDKITQLEQQLGKKNARINYTPDPKQKNNYQQRLYQLDSQCLRQNNFFSYIQDPNKKIHLNMTFLGNYSTQKQPYYEFE